MKRLFKHLAAVTLSLAILFTPVVSAADIYRIDANTLFVTNEINQTDDTALVYHLLNMPYTRELTILIDSPGGSGAGIANIVAILDKHKEGGLKVITEVHSYAFSAGGILFLQGDVRRMGSGAMLMFHEAHLIGEDNKPIPTEKLSPTQLTYLDNLNRWLAKQIAEITGMTLYEALKWMNGHDGVYLDAKEAMRLGIATEII